MLQHLKEKRGSVDAWRLDKARLRKVLISHANSRCGCMCVVGDVLLFFGCCFFFCWRLSRIVNGYHPNNGEESGEREREE